MARMGECCKDPNNIVPADPDPRFPGVQIQKCKVCGTRQVNGENIKFFRPGKNTSVLQELASGKEPGQASVDSQAKAKEHPPLDPGDKHHGGMTNPAPVTKAPAPTATAPTKSPENIK